ncbi:hypothetical protein J422_04253 [Methanocaldococcus villosus KIN24-T80]|uniref:Uncharacterized protein n=1 Tax=Methanocaldococcus villosus KIN24-T80 TaxID=1069083 RepID=N6VY61_9EURY|nr:hypothetical protein [Methanocaldococcus villosus]ENN96052.1 hypothetical protein J422_04253 [Methanocaldococcus villosus KIN24-T80]
MIYGVLLNIPEKYAPKYEDIIRKIIGEGIARGDIISFCEARYKGDVAFVMLARSRRAAQKVYEELKEHPIHVKVIEIEGKEIE